MDNSKPFKEEKPQEDKKRPISVIVGWVMILAGLLCFYFIQMRTVQKVIGQVPDVTYSIKGFMLGPLTFIMGLFYVIIKPADLNAKGSPREKKWLAIFVGIFLVVVFLQYFAFEKILDHYGYFGSF